MLYTYKAHCKRIIDGDTIEVDNVDLGFSTFIQDMTLRLNRINAPETRTTNDEEKKRGLESKKYMEKLADQDIIIQTQKSDSFSRWRECSFYWTGRRYANSVNYI